MSLQAQAIVLILLVLALVASLSVALLQDTNGAWIVFGSAQAITFAAAGAFFGLAVYHERVVQAEQRAQAAEDLATRYREDATRGRALAAVLQADEPSQQTAPAAAEVLLRHRHLSRKLLGNLVVPPAEAVSPAASAGDTAPDAPVGT